MYEILESYGLEVILANARETRSVPGRKTGVNDAQWIQRLPACGLLQASLRLTNQIMDTEDVFEQDEINQGLESFAREYAKTGSVATNTQF